MIYVKGRLPHPFIPTLAMLTAASGLALFLSHNETIQGAPPIVDDHRGGPHLLDPRGRRDRLVPGRRPSWWSPWRSLRHAR